MLRRTCFCLFFFATVFGFWALPAYAAEKAPAPSEAADEVLPAEDAEEVLPENGEDGEAESADKAEEAEQVDLEARATAGERELYETEPLGPKESGEAYSVYVIPVHQQIGKANRFVIRRGIKKAIANEIDAVVLDIDTPGGRVDYMLEIAEEVDRFPGQTLAFVNDEAISAGAYISIANDYIYFAPGGTIGAAEAVSGGGGDIPDGMKRKIDSYLRAKVRALASHSDARYRAQVMRAMMDQAYVLEIDGKVLKPEGELLTLTAQEALETYGEPPAPLLGNGIGESVEAVLDQHFGADTYEIRTFEITWSEELARWMETITPILLGVGFLALMIEFYTPGFGFPGITGLVLLAIVFLSNYAAGLAGYEPLIVLILGLVFLGVEVFLFPGTIVLGLVGVVMIFGSIIWSLADIWPSGSEGWSLEPNVFVDPAMDVFIGVLLAVVCFAVLLRFLPKSTIWSKLVLTAASAAGPSAVTTPGTTGQEKDQMPAIGSRGFVTRPLHPLGEVEVEGERYLATTSLGGLERGEDIVVSGYRNYYLLVDRAE